MSNHIEIFVHLVWATRNREPWLTPEFEPRIHACLVTKCRQLRCRPLAVGGMPEHVHLLVALHPTVPVAQLVKEAKGVTSYHFSQVLVPGHHFAWQVGYGAISLGGKNLATVSRYIRHQKEHHGDRTLFATLERM